MRKLAGAPPPSPSPRLEGHRPPLAAISYALGSPESVEAHQRLSLLCRGLHRRSAVIPLRRATMADAVTLRTGHPLT